MLLKISKSEFPDFWIRLPRHRWPKSRSNIEDPVVPLERNVYGHRLPGLLRERQFEEVLLELGWWQVPNWECLFVHRKQELFLSVYVDDIKMTGKKQNMAPMWKNLMKDVDLDETNIISWPRIFGMHSTWMQTKCNDYWGIYTDVWITYFCWSNWKITRMWKTSRKDGCVVLRHWRTCSKMCWEILRTGKQKDGADCTKFQALAWMIINSRQEELESVG